MAGSGFLKRVVLGSAAAAAAAVWAMGPRSAQNRKAHGVHALPDVMYAHRGLHDAGSGLVPAYAAQSGEYVALARRMALRAGYGTADHVGPIAPENSMAAFAAACEAGYGIELDIQLTADGKVVEGVDVEVHPAGFLIGALVIHFAADLEAEHAPILGRVECRSAAIPLGYDRIRYQLHHHVDYLLSFWGNKKAPNGG